MSVWAVNYVPDAISALAIPLAWYVRYLSYEGNLFIGWV